MRATVVLLWASLVGLGSAFGLDPDPRLVEIDRRAAFPGDFSARYTIVHQDESGKLDERVTAVFRRDQLQTFLVVTTKPLRDWGKGYLRIGISLWLYDPHDRQFSLTNAKERFESSNARLSDFSGSNWSGDYRVTSVGRENLGPYDCVVYDLEALRDDVTFPRTQLWVSDDQLVRKSLDYSLSNQLLRTVIIPSWQRVGTKSGWRFAPVKILISDNLDNTETQITITSVSTQSIPDAVYSKEYLEKLRP